MRRPKFYIILTFILTSLLLYLSHHYLNVTYNWSCCKFNLQNNRKTIIPSIVVYSRKDNSKEYRRCSSDKGIPNVSKTWQKVEGTNLFLYSAYYDDRLGQGNKFVRLLAMSKGQFNDNLFCKVWKQNSQAYAGKLKVQEMWIHSWDLAAPDQYYRPLLLSCEVDDDDAPVAISVTKEHCQNSNNALWVDHKSASPSKDFVVCLKPLNFKDEIIARLLEWIELQFILGADEVVAYITHLPPQSFHLLKMYEKQGRVSLRNLHLSQIQNDSNVELWQKRRNEMLMFNDCFYSHISTHRIVVNLDIDEVIVPLQQDTWKAMFGHISYAHHFASLSASNVYFFEHFGIESDETLSSYFYILRHTYRSFNFTPPGFAQKSFFMTNSCLVVTNHYALQSVRPHIKTNTAFKKDFARLHHYRSSCPPDMDKECADNYMKFKIHDTTMFMYKDKLVKKVNSRIKQFNLTL